MMTAAMVFVGVCLAALLIFYLWEDNKEIKENNDKAIKWANKMEHEHNVHVALYEDERGRIVDYKIYKL